MKRTFLWINFVLSTLIVVGIFVQAWLIASYSMGAGEGALDAHGVVGGLFIHGFELLVFLTAFGAWPRQWRWIGFCFLLFFVGTVQIFLLPGDDEEMVSSGAAYVHGLHGFFAIVVLVLAAIVAHRGLRDLGLKRSSRGDDAGTAPPQPLP
jgi:hypothetical protein